MNQEIDKKVYFTIDSRCREYTLKKLNEILTFKMKNRLSKEPENFYILSNDIRVDESLEECLKKKASKISLIKTTHTFEIEVEDEKFLLYYYSALPISENEIENTLSINSQTVTITFGDQAENHAGMQKLGKLAENGFSLQDLENAKSKFEEKGNECFILNLNDFNNGQGNPAYVLVIRKGVDSMLCNNTKDSLYKEQINLNWDTKALMRGRIVNKHARYNLCFDEKGQDSSFEEGKGTVIAYSKVPLLSELHSKLGDFFGDKAVHLLGEGNYYYDSSKCGIGFHGDGERRRVIALRLGATIPLHYQWFHRFKPVGKRAIIELNHGDMYMMSEKAVGFDWKRSSILTLRHAAGCAKYTSIEV